MLVLSSLLCIESRTQSVRWCCHIQSGSLLYLQTQLSPQDSRSSQQDRTEGTESEEVMGQAVLLLFLPILFSEVSSVLGNIVFRDHVSSTSEMIPTIFSGLDKRRPSCKSFTGILLACSIFLKLRTLVRNLVSGVRMLSGTRGARMAAMGFPWTLPSVCTPFIEKEVLEGTLSNSSSINFIG